MGPGGLYSSCVGIMYFYHCNFVPWKIDTEFGGFDWGVYLYSACAVTAAPSHEQHVSRAGQV